jgi:hypothetical protein
MCHARHGKVTYREIPVSCRMQMRLGHIRVSKDNRQIVRQRKRGLPFFADQNFVAA